MSLIDFVDKVGLAWDYGLAEFFYLFFFPLVFVWKSLIYFLFAGIHPLIGALIYYLFGPSKGTKGGKKKKSLKRSVEH